MARVLSGVVLAASFFAVAWFSSATVLLSVAIAVCVLGWREYVDLMRRIGAAVPAVPTLIATLAALVVVPFPSVAIETVLGIGLILIAIAAMAGVRAPSVQAGASPTGAGFGRAVQSVAAGGLSILYLGVPLGALIAVHIYGGRGAVLLLVGTIVVSDTAQYYAGRAFGRRPLAPRLSPKKTIEGAIGGFVMAPVFLYFAGPYLVPIVTPATIAPLGVPLAAAGIAGDLFESMLKRAADVKDSSTLIPGHGGVLDRIDALLFATPVFYMYLRWIYA